MDILHGMLRTLSSETTAKTKQATPPAPDHLAVFREFLSHLDRAQAQSRSKSPRAKPTPRKAVRAGKR